jgi:hypothetical protein
MCLEANGVRRATIRAETSILSERLVTANAAATGLARETRQTR